MYLLELSRIIGKDIPVQCGQFLVPDRSTVFSPYHYTLLRDSLCPLPPTIIFASQIHSYLVWWIIVVWSVECGNQSSADVRLALRTRM
jgi:hypothetical protein